MLGSPLAPVRFLLATLADDPHAPPRRAGEIVTTGTLTEAMPLRPGDSWSTTRDDPAQAASAERVIAGLTADAQGFVCREVVVALAWVLERAYRLPRADIAAALEGLLAAPEIEMEAADDVGTAILRYRGEGLGFADQMIAAAARRAGATKLVTFDRATARIDGVVLLEA